MMPRIATPKLVNAESIIQKHHRNESSISKKSHFKKSNKNSRNFACISPQPKLNNTNLNTKLAYKGITITENRVEDEDSKTKIYEASKNSQHLSSVSENNSCGSNSSKPTSISKPKIKKNMKIYIK